MYSFHSGESNHSDSDVSPLSIKDFGTARRMSHVSANGQRPAAQQRNFLGHFGLWGPIRVTEVVVEVSIRMSEQIAHVDTAVWQDESVAWACILARCCFDGYPGFVQGKVVGSDGSSGLYGRSLSWKLGGGTLWLHIICHAGRSRMWCEGTFSRFAAVRIANCLTRVMRASRLW